MNSNHFYETLEARLLLATTYAADPSFVASGGVNSSLVVAGDMNGDQLSDVAIATSNSINIRYRTASGWATTLSQSIQVPVYINQVGPGRSDARALSMRLQEGTGEGRSDLVIAYDSTNSGDIGNPSTLPGVPAIIENQSWRPGALQPFNVSGMSEGTFVNTWDGGQVKQVRPSELTPDASLLINVGIGSQTVPALVSVRTLGNGTVQATSRRMTPMSGGRGTYPGGLTAASGGLDSGSNWRTQKVLQQQVVGTADEDICILQVNGTQSRLVILENLGLDPSDTTQTPLGIRFSIARTILFASPIIDIAFATFGANASGVGFVLGVNAAEGAYLGTISGATLASMTTVPQSVYTFGSGSVIRQLAAGDIDSSGSVSIIATTTQPGSDPERAHVLRQQSGNSQLRSDQVLSLNGSRAAGLQLSDANGDGAMDVLVLVKSDNQQSDGVLLFESAVRAPVPVVGLAAEPLSATRVSLSWLDVSPNERNFRVERSTDGITWAQRSLLAANSTSFFDSGLNRDTTYFYRVVTIDTANQEGVSARISVRTLVASPPTITNVVMPAIVRPDDGRFADQFTLSVEAEDESGIRAAVFFIDYNTNGIWDNGFDKPLGDVFTPVDNRFSLTVSASADWPVVSQIGYNVVGNDGVWASARTRIVQVDAPPVVMSAIAMPINSTTIRVRARVSDYGYQLSPAGAVGAVSYFYDANRNGLWDAGTADTDLGTMQLNESTVVEGWWQAEFAASVIGGLPTDQNPKYLVVNARDQRVIVGSDPSGSFGREYRVAVRTDVGDPKLVPHVYQAPYTASIIPPREGWIVQGTTLTITPKAIAPTGTGSTQDLSRIDLYLDGNRNGLDDDGPNGGASTRLGSFALNSGTTESTTQSVAIVVDSRFATGPAMIGIVPYFRRTQGPVLVGPGLNLMFVIAKAPELSAAVGPSTVQPAQGLEYSIRAIDDLGVRAVNAFIDYDGNGIRNGNDSAEMIATPLTGSQRDGTWRITFSPSQVRRGVTGVLRIAAVDGQGFWSLRSNSTIQFL